MGQLGLIVLTLFASVGCVNAAKLEGMVRVDGSSTVYPVTAAIAEEFQRTKEFNKIRVTVAKSGTGGGFKKWCIGETDVNDASRGIKQKEIDCANKNKISYLELPVAYDGLSVVVSKKNNFLDTLTISQLKSIWEPSSKIKKWSQINPAWPDKEIKLFGPGADSGTFDYFTEEVVGKARASRSDYTASEDDNVIVNGVRATDAALGYFGYAYYIENKNQLKVVKIDAEKGAGAIEPTTETIKTSKYPLARPLHIYISSKAVQRPEVQAFIRYYLKEAKSIVGQVGYSPLADKEYDEASKKFESFLKTHAGKVS